MTTYKSGFSTIFALALSLCFSGISNAATLDLICRVSSDGARSMVKLNATGLPGKYYAKIFSGENIEQTVVKSSNKSGNIEFKFYNNRGYVVNNPGSIEITSHFIQRREVVGVIRKAGTNARVGGIRTKCTILKIQPVT